MSAVAGPAGQLSPLSKAHRLNLQPSDLNVQVRQVLDFYAPRPVGQGGGRRLSTGQSAHGAVGPRGVPRALLNLVLNAEQAMPQGGQLVSPHLRHARRRGPGLDRHRLRHGLRRRTRGCSTPFSRPSAAGRAWGCPTARKIIEGHGGAIALQSEVGRGTQVTLKLPVPARLPADGGG